MTGKRKEEIINLGVMGMGCLALHFIFRLHYFFLLMSIIAFIGIIIPVAGYWINRAWLKLSKLIGFFTSKILLAFVFYFVLFPIASLSNLFKRKDTLLLSDKTESTFIEVNKNFSKKDFEKLW